MTITFVGHGYVGLVTACVFADLGNKVYVIGHTPEKLKKLSQGYPLIFEPGLEELLKRNIEKDHLHFTTDYDIAIPQSEVVFIAVGTPPKESGEADLTSVLDVGKKIGTHLGSHYTVVSCKSTVPIGTNRKIEEWIKQTNPKADFDVASVPEFLREGSALQDTFYPDRIIIGSQSEKAKAVLVNLHEGLPGERLLTSLESAELIKYAANSLLATKISFANLVALLCERTGANVEEVLSGVGLDKRIGSVFLSPGVGYGGSCFPKDVKALTHIGSSLGVDMGLLHGVSDINVAIKDLFFDKIIEHCPGKNIAVWGLSFKPNTDDIREASSIYVIEKLLEAGFTITAYDPEAINNMRLILGDKIKYADSALAAIKEKEALLIFTEWNEFKQADLTEIKARLAQPVIFDGRNIYEPKEMKRAGFKYFSIGR